ncbi:MAG: hypothetical protein HY021_05310, partial [Burkholderiales bacterium]|nr:hypothetical protein [Burkholderiales bacterium]
MIRVFNHYLHAWTVRRILFDVLFALVALAAVVMLQVRHLELVMPIAGTQVVSLAAGMFVINTASGLYQTPNGRSLIESCLRAGFALVLALLMTYQLSNLLPLDFINREALRTSAMLVMSVVIVRRVFVGHWDVRSKGGSRVLIFGAGPAAQEVGSTLKGVDPQAKIVG